MAQRARSGRQLAIELPPELLQRLKTHAAANDQPVAALVRRWIEAGLGGALKAGAAAPDATGLADRVAALEAAVAALQQQGTPRAPRIPKPPAGEPLELAFDLSPAAPKPEPLPLAGGSQIPHAGDAPAAAITTVQLADQTGTNKNGWNNWARDKNPGAVRHHPEAGSWRLVGRFPSGSGGPDRCMWEPAAAC
jgi:hypothetical protein